jgi:hypothetical protein
MEAKNPHRLMKTLNDLKTRLSALPDIRESRTHKGLYAAFLKKSTAAAENLQKAERGASHASVILPATGYSGAAKTIKSSSGIASRLRAKLTDNPGAIVETSIDTSFTRLFENASSALKACQTTWETQLESKIKDWQAIAEVVSSLGEEEDAKALKTQARKLKASIDSLVESKKNLPQAEKDVSKAKNDLNELTNSVSQLGLDTPFGKFLQDAASPRGADLGAFQDEAVSKQIAELKLDKVFRVRLSS